MNNSLIQIKIKQRLNKLASFDYDNIKCWQVVEAFNKAQIQWVRRQIQAYNQRQEGDESTKMSIDDLQIIIKEIPLTLNKENKYYESNQIPGDYLYYKRISANVVTECCKDPRSIIVYLTENSNVDNLLASSFTRPSAEWGETFATLLSNKSRIYTNNEFDVVSANLTYYRKPLEISILDCADPSTGEFSTQEVECEFKDDIVELIIDEAASILAGDIESINQVQINKQNVVSNT